MHYALEIYNSKEKSISKYAKQLTVHISSGM